jgi:hypothetical protein
MSGAARCDRPTEAALQAIPPAIGTVTGHLTGRVIWDSPKLFAANGRNPQHFAQRSTAATRGAVSGDGVHAAFANAGVLGAVGGPFAGHRPDANGARMRPQNRESGGLMRVWSEVLVSATPGRSLSWLAVDHATFFGDGVALYKGGQV